MCEIAVKRTSVSLSFRTHPCVIAFITHIFCIKGNMDGMTLVWWISHRFCYIFFQNSNLLHSVDKSWWNMPYKETRHEMVWQTVLLRCCYGCDSTQERIHIVISHNAWIVMNIHYQIQITQRRFTNIIRTPSTQWDVCDNVVRINSTDIDICLTVALDRPISGLWERVGVSSFNSLRPSDAYMSVNFPSLVQIMACRLVGFKPLSKPSWNIVNLTLGN